jgi:hypothetical protein
MRATAGRPPEWLATQASATTALAFVARVFVHKHVSGNMQINQVFCNGNICSIDANDFAIANISINIIELNTIFRRLEFNIFTNTIGQPARHEVGRECSRSNQIILNIDGNRRFADPHILNIPSANVRVWLEKRPQHVLDCPHHHGHL